MFGKIYLSASGRCSRRFYWQFFILPFLVLGVVVGLTAVALRPSPVVLYTLGIVLAWPCAVMYIKRWHDIGLSGWFAILNFVPGLSLVMWLVLGCIPGTPGENKYGPNPISLSHASTL
jgi:uncharacterized membrane protein YhaH (DUF805 family)